MLFKHLSMIVVTLAARVHNVWILLKLSFTGYLSIFYGSSLLWNLGLAMFIFCLTCLLEVIETGTILKFYRLRSTTAFVIRPTIIRSKVIVSTILGSTIFKSTQNYNNQNCFYTNNVYRTYAYRYLHTQEMGLQD